MKQGGQLLKRHWKTKSESWAVAGIHARAHVLMMMAKKIYCSATIASSRNPSWPVSNSAEAFVSCTPWSGGKVFNGLMLAKLLALILSWMLGYKDRP